MGLEDLLVDENAIDRDVLAGALKGRVGITSSGEVRQLEGWDALGERKKVVAYLLGLKAAEVLKKRAGGGATPTVVAREAGVALGTAKRCLRELLAARALQQEPSGEYAVSAVTLRRAIAELNDGQH